MNQKQKCNHCGGSGIPSVQLVTCYFQGIFGGGHSHIKSVSVCKWCGSPDLEPTPEQVKWNIEVKRQSKIEKIIGWILVIVFSGLVLASAILANL